MQLFGNRRNTHRRGALSPWAIILICAGAAILLTLIIGLLLNVWLDDEAYARLRGEGQKEEEKAEINKSYTRDVHADAYVFGEEGDNFWESFYEVSVSLNIPSGQMNYTSEVVSYLATETTSERVLYDEMSQLSSSSRNRNHLRACTL